MTHPLPELCRTMRRHILVSSTAAGSGHPSSSLSGVELMTALFFGDNGGKPFFRYDTADPAHPNNDRLIFSKGHASPLFYGLWAVAGQIPTDELTTFRQFGGRLEGHPTPVFEHTEAATGSLGQGLSIGVGMALNAKLDKLPYHTFVLLGDSEMAEGSQWEAMALAAHDKLDNLVGILDANRLGQRGETMHGHDLDVYRAKAEAFGWQAIVVDGHDLDAVQAAYAKAATVSGKPAMIIAKTFKGRGVSIMEDKDGWHGKPLPEDKLDEALAEIGTVNEHLTAELAKPEDLRPAAPAKQTAPTPDYALGDKVACRKAYGTALARLADAHPEMVVLDAEVSNSTHANEFKAVAPERFFEMYIAEQNMAGAALGFSRRGKYPCVSSFAAFLSRAYDFIRMARYSGTDDHGPDMLVCGSHAGVSIGEDGASQMALEDLAFFRAILDSVVLYPSDAMSTERLVEGTLARPGLTYLRTTRAATPVLYSAEEAFPVGGSKTLRESDADAATILAAGITLHEALEAADQLAKDGVALRIIDCYSIKPLDAATVAKAASETPLLITVEDHGAEGGLGEAVAAALTDAQAASAKLVRLAVTKVPKSGKPQELLDYEGISAKAILQTVREHL